MIRTFLLAACALSASQAHAVEIASFSPQGEVATIRQLRVKFDAPVVTFGDRSAAAPVTLACSDAQATKGNGNWTSEREWTFNFESDLPAGTSCSARVAEGLRSPKGEAITGQTAFKFSSGGPFATGLRPFNTTEIDEEQIFIVTLTGPATLASVQASSWCELAGVGERVPVRLIDGAPRAAVLASQRMDKLAAREPLKYVTLACNRRLTPGSKLRLVLGKGLSSPGGMASRDDKRFELTVRESFSVSFTCERENAQAACIPIRPMSLAFNAPVPRKLAEGIVLKSDKQTLKPDLAKGEEDPAGTVRKVDFKGPFVERGQYTIVLPAGFQDDTARPAANAGDFPLKVGTAGMPPLAKFAAAPFGIVERLAEPGGVPLFPVTLRRVEPALQVKGLTPGSRVTDLRPSTDAEVIRWFRLVRRYDDDQVTRVQAARDSLSPLPKVLQGQDSRVVESRMVSLLAGRNDARSLELPKAPADEVRPFEVIGIPLTPGFHVLEIASGLLGQALLDERLGAARTMYVRSSALVTNLGVHFKLGRENALAWVTTLDKGKPVAGALVRVSDCNGKELASASTDARGLVEFKTLSPQPPACSKANDGYEAEAYFVSARAKDAGGVEDLAFTWSDWHRGIEPWRFNLPISSSASATRRAHTILDRSLLRAGETVSMKHLLRSETAKGFAIPAQRPGTLVVTHQGSGQRYTQPLVWRQTATGGLSAENTLQIPPAAKLGAYSIELQTGDDARKPGFDKLTSGEFRVEEFRLPVFTGQITPTQKQALVHAKSVATDVQINYLAGGGAANLPVRVSALVRNKSPNFAGFDNFSFEPPRQARADAANDEEDENAVRDERVVADKLPLTLDRNGAGRLSIENLPTLGQPADLLLEATYADPSGEIQTIRNKAALWPAGVVAGIRTEGWVSVSSKLAFQALALDLNGKPLAGVPLEVRARARITTSSRKRIVGGFYSYDNRNEMKELGSVCSGTSDARGLLLCETALKEPGNVELIASARDQVGNSSQAAASVWVTRQGELWFGGENTDRIDVLPEKKNYEPGEDAKFQVRMPFRFATALVSVEREGVIETQVVELNGQDPTVSVKVRPEWGPNVYVSVLALRGRLREVPWYSFFTWGWKAPREWLTAFRLEGRDHVAPTALVDLSKPSFKFGVAEIGVGSQAHRIDVKLSADKPSYAVRSTATVTITARLPNGQPAAGAEVALAAVDQALLELSPNPSWNLLSAMLQRRLWGVETATAQMEIIGRRHYGRKAVAAGGSGGRSPTRELLDTLLLWNPRVMLDANGQAVVKVPLNDALTSFRIVAVADAGTGLFGSGDTSIQSAQDLQIISGLPPLVREEDQFRAQFTLRNTSKKAMKVELSARATLVELKPQTVYIPPGEARELNWDVTAPAQLGQTRAESLVWEITAADTLSGARDALKARQRIIPAIALSVQQATMVQLAAPLSLGVGAPADALPGTGVKRGGLRLSLQPRLSEGLPGVRDWFANYPFICLEQKTSKSVGLRDAKLWQGVLAQLPGYLDNDGLASYFPPRNGEAQRGSDSLTAYLLAASHEAASLDPAFALPDSVRAPMERGLAAFVEGRITRDFWSPRKDLDVRKLAAIEALSRYGKAQARQLQSISLTPNQWPTGAVIDWLNILRRVTDVPQREQRMAEAGQILRSRLSWQGTRVGFSSERDDYWWWLMINGDVNTARLLLTVMDDPAWKDDIGRLANGFIARQQNGAWLTTTANLWGGLALEKFSRKFEAAPVTGSTRASLGAASAAVDWARVERIKPADANGAPHQASWFGAPASAGNLRNNSMFLSWPAGTGTLNVTQQGSGKPWLTVQSVAAIELKEPVNAGYRISKTITPVEQAVKGQWTRGDVLRVSVEVNASADMSWVAITDPVPAGATILGGGLGRDSQISSAGEKREGRAWSAFDERSFEAWRSYYEYLPKGVIRVEYTIRLNNVGDFALPPSRVEAMYAPEMFGAAPNPRIKVMAAR